MYSDTFLALHKEADFTKEMLGAGATYIRQANYAAKGIYFQAFTSLSTGLERIGKLCLLLDHFIDHGGHFPSLGYMKGQIGHELETIYDRSQEIVARRSMTLPSLSDLNDPIHKAMLKILSEFAKGDRYSNIDLLVGAKRKSDPIAAWAKKVDQLIYDTCVPVKKKIRVQENASAVALLLGPAEIMHSSETGEDITTIEDGAQRAGMQKAIAAHRQLYVLQIIRYWAELLLSLETNARQAGGESIPFFNEIFFRFLVADSYIKTRKKWTAN